MREIADGTINCQESLWRVALLGHRHPDLSKGLGASECVPLTISS